MGLSMVEVLESRRLLSASLSGGVLTITGTEASDVLEVQLRSEDNELRVQDNGRETEFPLGSVQKIVINGLGGNDFIEYSGRDGGLAIPGELSGGNDSDTIQGGLGNDTITGGPGRDRIQGKEGDDLIAGNGSSDFIEGGEGNDTITGASGNDRLFGNGGVDFCTGGRGNDTVRGGGGGDDSCFGGSGIDTFDDSDLRREQRDRNQTDAIR